MLSLTGMLVFIAAAGMLQWFVMHLIWRRSGLDAAACPALLKIVPRVRRLARKSSRAIWLALLLVTRLFRRWRMV